MPLNDDVKKSIQGAYSQFLKAKGLKPRYGQKLMIAAIARVLGELEPELEDSQQHVCVVEAGTGTGKTVAYLLATLPIAAHLGKKVVISTATVALQEQIVFKDLPDVKRHSGLQFAYGLVKGRGRYLCLSKLDRILQGDPGEVSFVSESDLAVSADELKLYSSMTQALAENRWDGDRDSWPTELEGPAWSKVTTDHRQCSGRRCSFVRQCAFFRARDTMEDLDCVVANHDLVLADLALGGGAILPAPKDTIYIFDEAHHLPDKALDHFAAHARVVATSRWLGMTEGQWSKTVEPLKEAFGFSQLALKAEPLFKQARVLLDELQPHLLQLSAQMDHQAQTVRYRFPDGQAPENIEILAQQLEVAFGELHDLLAKLSAEVDRLLEDEHGPVSKDTLEELYPLLGTWVGRAEANLNLWRSYSDTRPDPQWPVARWATLVGSDEVADFELVSCPILASHTLTKHLWEPCFAAVATSATLTALGSFDRFQLRSGTSPESHYEVVPSPFQFAEKAVLRVPADAVEANPVDAHTASLVKLLPEHIAENEATLVLFASRRQMLDVYEDLPAVWQNQVLMQGNESKQMLLEKHKKRVDAGTRSILFGLASFAEGVDLPGNYCRHVIIAKIPFAVPDDPIEASMAEWVERRGGNAFMQISVPDAATKMVQACGRLLRTEADEGRVTVLDKRLVTKRYGSAIMDSLPPFRRDINC